MITCFFFFFVFSDNDEKNLKKMMMMIIENNLCYLFIFCVHISLTKRSWWISGFQARQDKKIITYQKIYIYQVFFIE